MRESGLPETPGGLGFPLIATPRRTPRLNSGVDMHTKRNFGLDLLRAIAITGVFFGHAISALEPLGIGVRLFFVLSGFLIGRIYFRSHVAGNFHLGDFWISRWWRTLPPYFAALGVFLIFEHWVPSNPLAWYYAFFLQTFLGMKGFGPSWSLCVEEHFYLVMPLLALATERIFGSRSLKWILPVFFFTPLLLRAAAFAIAGGVDQMPNEWYRMTPFNCDGLIAGVYVAYLFVVEPLQFKKLRTPAWICAPLVFVPMLVPAKFSGHVVFDVCNTMIEAVGFAAWLRLAYDIAWQPLSFLGRWTEKTIRGIALTSYSIYLIHVLALTDIRVLLDGMPRGILKTTAIMIPTILLCIVFYFLVEKPSIVTRDWYLSRKKKADLARRLAMEAKVVS